MGLSARMHWCWSHPLRRSEGRGRDNCSSKSSINMMIDAMDSLLDIHNKVRPLSDNWNIAFHRRRDRVLGPNKWEDAKSMTNGVDFKTILFGIPPRRTPRKPPSLRQFRIEVATSHIYDMFIGSYGHFPHHDHVSLYFSKHI